MIYGNTVKNVTLSTPIKCFPASEIHTQKFSLQLLKNLNHELRTSLTGILGRAWQLSQEQSLNSKQLEWVNDIEQCGKLLHSVVTKLLEILANQAESNNNSTLTIASQITKKTAPIKPQAKTKAIKVLVVDDDKIIQKVHTSMLINKGYEVDLVEDGKQAVEKAHQHYDLILMDIRMPVMDGITATREIRLLKGIAKHTPIIGLTGDGEEIKRECLAAGMNAFATKPIGIESLSELVEKFIIKTE